RLRPEGRSTTWLSRFHHCSDAKHSAILSKLRDGRFPCRTSARHRELSRRKEHVHRKLRLIALFSENGRDDRFASFPVLPCFGTNESLGHPMARPLTRAAASGARLM